MSFQTMPINATRKYRFQTQVMLLMVILCSHAHADTATEPKSPLQIAAEEADYQAKIAEAKQREAEAKAAVKLANIPESTASALKGQITAESFGIMGTYLSVSSTKSMAKELCGKIKEYSGNVLIYDETLFNRILLAQHVEGRIDDLTKDANEFLGLTTPPQGAPAPRAILSVPVTTAATKSVIDFISLFKTDITIKQSEVTEAKRHLLTYLASGQGCKVKFSYIGFGYLGELKKGEYEALRKKVTNLIEKRSRLNPILEYHKGIYEKNKNDTAAKSTYEKIEKLTTSIDTLITELKINDTSETSPLVVTTKLLLLSKKITQPSSQYVLDVDYKSEGITIIKDSLFTGQKLRLSAASICSYMLYDINGELKTSGMLRHIHEPEEINLRGKSPTAITWQVEE